MPDEPTLEFENPYGDQTRLRTVFLIAAVIYPFWHLAAPASAIDPWWAWWAVAASFIAVIAASMRVEFVRQRLPAFLHLCAWLCALQLYLLASINGMHPFYAIGSVMSVFSTAVSIRTKPNLVAFGLFIFGLSATLYVLDPNMLKVAYWGGTLTVVGAAYYRLDSQLTAARLTEEHQERLERRVRDRTSDLSEANRRLRREMEERARLEDELRLAQKLEALGRLAGGVAHEFNNLLTRIRLYAELAVETVDDGSPVQAGVAEIHEAVRQAATLTQQLLTFSRRGQVENEVLDMNEVVLGFSSMLRHLLGEDIPLRVLADGRGDRFVEADRGQLEQILVNLTLNARDAMPNGGQLTIETTLFESVDVEAIGLSDVMSTDDHVGLIVSDTGVGMDAETRSRAFDPFFTRKQVDEGTGLGLSIIYGIVVQAGGHVRVLSEPGKGARFELYWPRSRNQPATATAGSEATLPPLRGDERILLVEDQAELRVALRRLLEGCGYEVIEAGDGEAALELAQRQDASFDLVLSDVVMPRMGGIELVKRMAALHPQTRFLLISGHLNQPAIRDQKLPESVAMLMKPFDPEDLTTKVREILDGRVPMTAARRSGDS